MTRRTTNTLTAWLGGLHCWWRQATHRNQAHPAWSVADENQGSEGSLQSAVRASRDWVTLATMGWPSRLVGHILLTLFILAQLGIATRDSWERPANLIPGYTLRGVGSPPWYLVNSCYKNKQKKVSPRRPARAGYPRWTRSDR